MLDVLLRKNGTARHWVISEFAGRWVSRYTDGQSITFGGFDTLALALAQKAQSEAEIAAAKADGWT